MTMKQRVTDFLHQDKRELYLINIQEKGLDIKGFVCPELQRIACLPELVQLLHFIFTVVC